jgi:hypothetical protein
MIFDYGKPEGSRLVFGEDFRSRQIIQSRGGVITGTPKIGNEIGGSFEASANNTDMVAYANQCSLLDNATQATWVFRLRTGSNVTQDNTFLTRYVNTTTGSFYFDIYSGSCDFGIVNRAAGDRYLSRISPIVANTDYHMVFMWDGINTVKAAWVNGASVVLSAIAGTFPARMSGDYAGQLEVFAYGGAKYSQAGLLLRSARIFNVAWNAQEALDDYNQNTYSRAFGGGP